MNEKYTKLLIYEKAQDTKNWVAFHCLRLKSMDLYLAFKLELRCPTGKTLVARGYLSLNY